MKINFEDYEASYITPQKTLLQKLNAILKYLETYNPKAKLYRHVINDGTISFQVISFKKTAFTGSGSSFLSNLVGTFIPFSQSSNILPLTNMWYSGNARFMPCKLADGTSTTFNSESYTDTIYEIDLEIENED